MKKKKLKNDEQEVEEEEMKSRGGFGGENPFALLLPGVMVKG